MDIWVKHFPEYDLTLYVLGGRATREALLQFVDRLDPIKSRRWVTYLDSTLDLSGLNAEDFPAIKQALAEKFSEIHGDVHLYSVMTSDFPSHEGFLRFWPSYVDYDLKYQVKSAAVPTMQAACSRLGLPKGACEALTKAVSVHRPNPTDHTGVGPDSRAAP
jgi:hypothetical protein